MIPHTFGDRVLDFRFPQSWQEMNQEQLRYVFLVTAMFPATKAKTYIFMRFTGIKVHKKTRQGWVCSFRKDWRSKLKFLIQDWQMCSFLKQLDYVFEENVHPVRLEQVGGRVAMDAVLHGLTFENYLICENYYQGYLYTQDESQLRGMYAILYQPKRQRWQRLVGKWKPVKSYELISIFLWWSSIKLYFAGIFPHFFQPFRQAEASEQSGMPDMMAMMNAQIRALTGGDVTKEAEVLQMDCWRALTELDAKAHDVQEMKRKQKK